MTDMTDPRDPETGHGAARTILIVGASRGLGHGLAAEYLKRGWTVIGTVRDATQRTPLLDLQGKADGRLEIEHVDICEPDHVVALRERLRDRVLDTLFVNAGIASDGEGPVGDVPTDEFVRVMVTNTLSPMRVVERLQDLVPDTGLIGVMSSGQGSVANNTAGSRDLYRASKAALNTAMRCFAARHADRPRTMVLMAPGWIRTALGGSDAPFTIEQNVPKIVDVLLAQTGTPGLGYLDYAGRTVPW